jgi:DNA repair protein RadA/Sms
VRPVSQTSARLREAAKLGFTRAILPEAARGEAGDTGIDLSSTGSLSSLVADIAQQGTPSPRPQRVRRQEG